MPEQTGINVDRLSASPPPSSAPPEFRSPTPASSPKASWTPTCGGFTHTASAGSASTWSASAPVATALPGSSCSSATRRRWRYSTRTTSSPRSRVRGRRARGREGEGHRLRGGVRSGGVPFRRCGLLGAAARGAGHARDGQYQHHPDNGRLWRIDDGDRLESVGDGLPLAGNAPVVVDMATSETTWGALLHAEAAGTPIPETWALGPDGQPTTSAVEAVAAGRLLPFGRHKGYALAVGVELLTGALAGANCLADCPHVHGAGEADGRASSSPRTPTQSHPTTPAGSRSRSTTSSGT